MKKIIAVTLMFLVMSTFYYTFADEGSVISVTLEGEPILFDTEPEIVNDRTMVPVAKIFEALGLEVIWEAKTQKVIGRKETLEINLYIGSDMAYINDKAIKLDAEAYISNGRTMVPLRFVAESTGANVAWDGVNRVVAIKERVDLSYKIVDTGVSELFTDHSSVMTIGVGEAFYGQDGHYQGHAPTYQDNLDGTITDLVTGLMWQKTMDSKMSFTASVSYANNSRLAAYEDWRIPTIKELFSLIIFTGESGGESAKKLYIDTQYFDQPIGDTSIGEREIDAQVWSSTEYVGQTMHGDATVFGVNFIDGRIKGYGKVSPKTRSDNTAYFRLVRGNEDYGKNQFVNNHDGTITDLATGLMWQMKDDGVTRNWQEALGYAENLELGTHTDWRLPNVKELQSIVDYTLSLQTSQSAAIDNNFELTPIKDPNNSTNYGFYWTSTTHKDGMNTSDSASYVAFGEAQGQMFGDVIDVHGCGAVRSDPKSGDRSDFPSYFGPQGDVRYVYNFVLSVRDQ